MTIRKVRYYIFLKDVIVLAVTAFGGPQAHFGMMLDMLVKKRRYLDEQEFIELHALCQFLPGPTSTQTLTAIGFKVGGPNLAYLTLLVWIIPAFLVMSTAGVMISSLESYDISLEFTRFIQPMAVGIVSYSAFLIIKKVIHTKLAVGLMLMSAVCSFLIRTPYVFPALILVGGAITAFDYKRHEKEPRNKIEIQWSNFFLWAGVLVGAALVGAVTKWRGIDLFENFYRIGSLIFGGGQVLVPHLYTEFVEFKRYLSSEEFLSGYALVQAVPGPVFSFAGFVGAVSMRDYGITGQYLGGFLSAVGVFLPGAFLIFFVIRFWDELKKFRIVKASLDGINAVSAGMIIAAALLLSLPLFNTNMVSTESSYLNIGIIVSTFLVLTFTKIPTPILIIAGLILGIVL
ncbi:chromate efflux transporter [Reichenbachiella agarivorans]|uniref:Chromate efflux transporter n=1 Tax=Reichenbachiella agarivorans TaxID=2979464 RepID=A0ABY6CW30_9BACT|nr:chromate efflux transporter [Reichenbachiella agarivorans]UXP33598.1 chromate efflux transporter [Reichenbachiella agarivorans]